MFAKFWSNGAISGAKTAVSDHDAEDDEGETPERVPEDPAEDVGADDRAGLTGDVDGLGHETRTFGLSQPLRRSTTRLTMMTMTTV